MNLQDVVRKLGDKEYRIGKPIYHGSDDEEVQPVQVHADHFGDWRNRVGTIETLRERGRQRSNGHKEIAIAYAGFLGADLAAARGAEGVLLVDVNPDQKIFWRSVISLIEECPTVGDFNNRMSRVRDRFHIRHTDRSEALVDESPPSFVDNEQFYSVVRGWVENGMMVSTDMDALDTERHEQLSRLLQEANMATGLVYLSNVPYFFRPDGGNGFYERTVGASDLERIFQNQRIVAPETADVVEAVFEPERRSFRLESYSLGEKLQDRNRLT